MKKNINIIYFAKRNAVKRSNIEFDKPDKWEARWEAISWILLFAMGFIWLIGQ